MHTRAHAHMHTHTHTHTHSLTHARACTSWVLACTHHHTHTHTHTLPSSSAYYPGGTEHVGRDCDHWSITKEEEKDSRAQHNDRLVVFGLPDVITE